MIHFPSALMAALAARSNLPTYQNDGPRGTRYLRGTAPNPERLSKAEKKRAKRQARNLREKG